MTSHDSASSPIEEQATTDVTGSQAKPHYWRSLAQYRNSEEFNEYLDREFPVAASEFPEGVSRRRWMQLMGASLAVAGAAGCRYPVETIEPFVIRPEGRVPGETYQRATNFELAGRAYNLLVTCFDGRPLKIEPNIDHPDGAGTDPYIQASILGLYDPDRSRGNNGFLMHQGPKRPEQEDWDAFDGAEIIDTAAAETEGSKFAVLMSPTASPSLVKMLKKLKQRLPKASLCRYDGVTDDVMRQATTQVFGKPANQVLALDQADVIVSIQADFLGNDKGMLAASRSFAKRRDPLAGDMNRLYVVEGGFTNTGAAADSRLAMPPSQMPAFLAELSRSVARLKAGENHVHSGEESPFDKADPKIRLERFLDVLAHDLADAGDRAVVVVGEHLGADLVQAGIEINQQLGSLGKAQQFSAAADADLQSDVTLYELVDMINGNEIDSLLILGDNPVTTAPGDVDLATAIGKLKTSLYLGEYHDETGVVCTWSLPLAHPLETWGDCLSDQGHYGVCQPHILPLLGGKPAIEVLAMMLGENETDAMKIVRRTADEIAGSSLSERQWRKLLHDGFAEKMQVEGPDVSAVSGSPKLSDAAPVAVTEVQQDEIEVIFNPADGIYDGRFANNGWLQEMPQSLTKLTWDNCAVMSPATASALNIRHGQSVALNGAVELPIFEMPGCAPGVVSVSLGYGRTRAGMVGGNSEEGVPVVGTSVSPIRERDAMLVAYKVEARPRYRDYELATTQDHWAIDERGMKETESRSFTLVREGTVDLLNKVPKFAESKGPHVPKVGENGSTWREPVNEIVQQNKRDDKDVPQWGMSIDLSKCTGCNACVIACQSENNVPIVGREQVINSREMQWLRVDRYFQGDETNATVVQQPVACVHCETAPCEQVCPVAATVHTDEGINAMAYNRCIGTRYCANNCPFKVRRFNYFNYNTDVGVGYGIDAYEGTIESAPRKLQALGLNPDVTVRGRGVMEKCTYCIQRVEKAKIKAIREDRAIQDGDVVTACQSACASNAIEFGNIEDPDSAVAKKRAQGRSYGLLEQLNLKPRTEYLARIRNPHPRLMTEAQIDDLKTIEPPHHDDHHGEHEDHDDHAADGEHAAGTPEADSHGDGDHSAASTSAEAH